MKRMGGQMRDEKCWQAVVHVRRMDASEGGPDLRVVALEEGEPGACFKVYGKFPSEDAFISSIESYLIGMNVALDEVTDFHRLEGNPVPGGIDETCMQETENGLIVFPWHVYLNEDA